MKSNSTPMKSNLTPIASAVSVLIMSVAMSAHAQEAAPAVKAEAVQEVTVTGIRGALQSAVRIKRNSSAVVDAVSAEDIGKLPDSDVGESLGRIPGVTVGRSFGQGSQVSVRGSDPQMTFTTLNGQTVASTIWYDQLPIDRSFNYSLLPSELIGGLEVYKSSQADLTEGGIGGTVIVKTRKPLDMKANSVFASVGVGKGTLNDDLNKDVNAVYSWKNASNTFGVLVGGAYEQGDYIRRGIEADTRWSGDIAPVTFVQERKRTALNLALQARPMTGLTLGANYLALKVDADNANTGHLIFPDANCTERNTAVTSGFNPTGICLKSTTTAANATPAFVQTWVRTGSMTSDSLVLDAAYKGAGFKVSGVLGATESDGGTSQTTNFAYAGHAGWGNAPLLPTWTGSIDATGSTVQIMPSSDQTVTLANLPATMAPSGSWATNKSPNRDEEKFAQVDLTMDLGWGVINSFKTGLRLADHTFTRSSQRSIFSATTTSAPTESLYSGTHKMGTPGWSMPRPDIGAMIALTNANITGWAEERGTYAQLNENNAALYGMFGFEKDDVSGNFGLRYIRTKAESDSYAFAGTPLAAGDIVQNSGWGTTLVTEKAIYNDVLPSLNLAVKLRNDLTMRFTAASTITRPNYQNMFGATQTGFNDDRAGNETLNRGTVALKPMKANQFDFGLEYYYGKGNLVSVMYFHKDINNFLVTNTMLNQSIGVVDPGSGVDSWTVNSFANGGGGRIDGIEAQVQHAFANGFGIAANYTYSDAKAPTTSYTDALAVFTNSSKHNTNLVGYWENDKFSARTAYNWRSKYMVRETGWYGNRMHDDFGTLDLTLGWNINDKIKLAFEATNLLKEDDVQFGAAAANNPDTKDPLKAGYPAWSFMGEAVYKLTLSAKF
jgi:iron complex outermembrane receptor protein